MSIIMLSYNIFFTVSKRDRKRNLLFLFGFVTFEKICSLFSTGCDVNDDVLARHGRKNNTY